MRKKLTIFATLIVALALGFASQALGWESTAPADLPEQGTFYLYNVGQGKYLHQGADWGTRAILCEHSYALKLIKNADGTINLQPLNGTAWLGDNAFMDNGTASTITLTATDGGYTLTNAENNKLGWDGAEVSWGKSFSGNNATWQLLSEDQMLANLSEASVSKPVDATFLVKGPRKLRNNNEWTNSWTLTPSDKFEGIDPNAKYSSFGYLAVTGVFSNDFDFSQEVKLPAGVYKFAVNGFYRYGDRKNALTAYNNGQYVYNSYIYAGDNKAPLAAFYERAALADNASPDNTEQAAICLMGNMYPESALFFEIAEEGTYKLGVKNESHYGSDWTMFEGFTLMYYGTEADVETAKVYDKNISELKDLLKQANYAKTQTDNSDTVSALDAAISNINSALASPTDENLGTAKATFNAAVATEKLTFNLAAPVTSKISTYGKDMYSSNSWNSEQLDVLGWSIPDQRDGKAAGVFSYGSSAVLGDIKYPAPATNPEGEASGNALGLLAVWSSTVQYTTPVTLEAGAYEVTYYIHNANSTTALKTNLFGFIPENGSSIYGTTTEFPVGEWTKETISFLLKEETTGNISVGYAAPNSGTEACPKLFVDRVEIVKLEEANKTALTEAFEAAKANLGFEIGQNAPYTNLDAMGALVDAENLLNEIVLPDRQSEIDDATSALTSATWTANTERMDAVYNGDFLLCENLGALPGWRCTNNTIAKESSFSSAYVRNSGDDNYTQLGYLQPNEGTRAAAYLRFDGTGSDTGSHYVYGSGDNTSRWSGVPSKYCMPLCKDYLYEFSCDFGNWGDVSNVRFYIKDAADKTVAEITYKSGEVDALDKKADGVKAQHVSLQFAPTVDGNCNIWIQNPGDKKNRIMMSNVSVKRIKKDQTINWDQEFEALQEGSEVELTATASSGLDVAYELVDPTDVAKLEGNKLTFLKDGSVQVKATQEGNDDFNAAEPVVQTIMAGAVAKSLADVVKMDPTTPFFVGFDLTVVYNNYVYDGKSYYLLGTYTELTPGDVIPMGWQAKYDPDNCSFYPNNDELSVTVAEEKGEVPSPVKLTPEANAFDYVRTVKVNLQMDSEGIIATTSDGRILPIANMFNLEIEEDGLYNLVGFVYMPTALGGGGDEGLHADGDDDDGDDDDDDDDMAVEPGSYPFAFVPISIEPFVQYLPDGKYFFYNVGQNGYLHQGGSWGTRSVLTPYAYALEVTNDEYNGTITVNTVNGGFFGNDNYMDKTDENPKAVISLTKNEAGNFTLTNANGEVFGFNAEKNELGWGESNDSEWKILSAAELEAALAEATATSTMDATFFLNGPRLLINNTDFQKSWSYGDTQVNMGTGDKYKDGNSFWTAAEVYNAPVDFHQTVKLAKGTYKLELDGFYRFGEKADALAAHNAGTEHIKAVMYAGEYSEPLMSIFDAEGLTDLNNVVYDLITASKALASGKYSDNVLYFNVPEAGEVTLGVKNAENADKDWTAFNNFRLTYYGAETTVDEAKAADQAAVVLAELQEMLKKAQDAKEAAEAVAVANAYEAAIVAINAAIAEQTDANVKAAKDALAAADTAAERYAGLEEMLATAKLYASQTADEEAKTALGAAVTALEAAVAAPADDEKVKAAETAYKAGVDAIPTSEYLNFQIGTVVTPGVVTYKKDAEKNNTEYYNEVAVAGWNIPANGDGPASGLMAYGSDAWLGGTGFTVPATNPEGKAEGNALGMVSCWSAPVNYLMPYELEAGKYRIDFKIMNINGTDEFAKNLFGFIDEDGVEYLATAKSYKVGEWVTESVEFELTDDMAGNISIGYVAPNAKSDNAQRLFLDNVTITKVEDPVQPELKAQTITWDQTFTDVKLNKAVTLNATASSGLEVTYALKAANDKVTLSAASLTFTDYTSVVVVASQAGNDKYAAAESVEKTIECVASGIARILADDPDARFFNLDGHQVKNPQPDKLYIVIKNGKAFKAIVK